MEPKLTLTYLNEDDRAYGLAGMALSLAAYNALDRVSEISLDEDGPMVTFSNEYYFTGSPSISPKATWVNLVNNYRITSAMAIANLMARSLVRMHREVPGNLIEAIHQGILEEGRDTCGLENDEIEEIYSRLLMHSRRIFGNPRNHSAINELARLLSRRRTLTGLELYDEISNLRPF